MAKARSVFLALCLMQLSITSRAQEPTDLPTLAELSAQLQQTTADAELLFSQSSSRAANNLQKFLDSVPSLTSDVVAQLDRRVLSGPQECLSVFNQRLKKIRQNTHVLAEYNAENHQKFFLAHMIVFRMHLNKSADFIKRSETALRTCPSPCRSTQIRHNLIRWHRCAFEEMHRVKDDLQHSRLAYRDLLTHSIRRLNRIRRRAEHDVQATVSELHQCAGNTTPRTVLEPSLRWNHPTKFILEPSCLS